MSFLVTQTASDAPTSFSRTEEDQSSPIDLLAQRVTRSVSFWVLPQLIETSSNNSKQTKWSQSNFRSWIETVVTRLYLDTFVEELSEKNSHSISELLATEDSSIRDKMIFSLTESDLLNKLKKGEKEKAIQVLHSFMEQLIPEIKKSLFKEAFPTLSDHKNYISALHVEIVKAIFSKADGSLRDLRHPLINTTELKEEFLRRTSIPFKNLKELDNEVIQHKIYLLVANKLKHPKKSEILNAIRSLLEEVLPIIKGTSSPSLNHSEPSSAYSSSHSLPITSELSSKAVTREESLESLKPNAQDSELETESSPAPSERKAARL